ncbi:MAG: class I SAM-dependent methyltransferase [Candidatus Omnitrophica bacterium]|nr:class I SAM-dependent methyltransferase [Candidatus Omnitrophota bacterium]
MGILRPHLFILAEECRKRYSITGDVLVLGQQAVYSTLNEVSRLFMRKGLNMRSLPEDFDTANKIPAWKDSLHSMYTNCQTVFKLLGADNVYVTDISGHEGADILMDLNSPCDKKYYNRFDTIFDVGTLEHVFNLPQALDNIHKCCKPGGQIILINPATNAINHGFYQISPTLYHDFFDANGYDDFSCYLTQISPFNYEAKSKIYKFKKDKISDVVMLTSKSIEEIAFFCRKKRDYQNSETKIPIQRAYQNIFSGKITSEKRNKLQAFVDYLFFLTRRWRPEIIDRFRLWLFLKKRLIYIGKH